MSDISAVVLAAGESLRMGAQNKLRLSVEGEPLLRKTMRTLLASRLTEIVVVLGHEAEQSRELLTELPVTVVVNEHYQQGQMSSVHAGMKALSADCDGIMVCLSDQPLLESADINALIEAFAQRSHGSVLVPTYQGQRGNPIVMAYQHRQAILSGDRNLGCKRLIEKNPQLVCSVEMDNEHFVFDVDTPEDYAELVRRTIDSNKTIAASP